MGTARDLADRLASLLRREQGAMAEFLLTLADFDRKRLWLALGYSSLAKEVSAELAPTEAAPHRNVVTALPAAAPARAVVVAAQAPALPTFAPLPADGGALAAPSSRQGSASGSTDELQDTLPLVSPRAAAPRSSAEPLTADLRRLHVTVSKRFTEKLEAARDASGPGRPAR
ncbi:MAG: hypothetical protein WCC48_12600, partial [Anaeromyxobacteraceae bacterium]